MRREEEDLGIAPEGILSAIAMVDVEVHDENALQIQLAEDMAGGDGHIVEDTEAHSSAGQGMMAWRAHQVEASADPAI